MKMNEAETINDPDQIDLTGDGGVLKKIFAEGTSEEKPTSGCKVALHYTGTLVDGTKFDSSFDRDEPFEFELDKGSVIKAFDIGVSSMKKGEKSVLTCASEYAYGKVGSPPNIPPNATLLFELELLDWKPEDLSPKNNGGVLRQIIKKAISRKTPNDGSECKVHLLGKFGDRVFDDREVIFSVNETPTDEVIEGIQAALLHFGKNEKSHLTIKPEYAFGAKGNEAFIIPPDATVEYIVTLHDFEKEPESWKLNPEESLVQAKIVKDKATNFLKQEKYQLAIKLYEKSNKFLSNCKDEESQKVKAAVFSNIALCHLKLMNYLDVKKACETVLEIEPNNVKAHYRRGQSYLGIGEPDLALDDFAKIQQFEPDNRAASNQITICKHAIKEYTVKQKQFYTNMFSKFSNEDNEKKDEDESKIDIGLCGEWTNEEGDGNLTSKEAKQVFDEVNRNVVML